MKCVICKYGETQPSNTTVTLERDGLTMVIKNVPALVCQNCGEAYVNEGVTSSLLSEAEEMVLAGILVDIRQYTPV
jgi:YgiT-type zinc finger domain-containing protein